ncbi:DNA polymerase [Methanobacterium sp. CWC-01]|uniref:DNA-directed DNA polymerase n=1 Tax=Methanobacterium aridiramus TaxID=2584467 RepID=UPI0025779E84|nr:DNA-directed DNA polymerase [Methanobacterium sp. CWC-01]WJI09628.1 DNA polymerase [Methanobacterium sp. CWC-01]
METATMVLLDIDYVTEEDMPVIRLFGTFMTEKGPKSIIALDRDFQPYIYVIPNHLEKCREELAEFNVVRVEKVGRKDLGRPVNVLKVFFKHPQDVPRLRDEIANLDSVDDIREYDLPFYRRYLIDKGLFPMGKVQIHGNFISSREYRGCLSEDTHILEITGEPVLLESDFPELKILSFDIETYNPKGMPRAEEDPIIMISLSSNEGLRKVISTAECDFYFVKTVATEEEILEEFMSTVKKENPNIILGYNSDNFDFNYINERAKKLGISVDLGTDGSSLKFMRRGFTNAALVKGRVHVDLYLVVRRYLSMDRYTLERVYWELFGEDKEDIPGNEICDYWDNGGLQLDSLFKYSLDDAEAVTKIGEKMLPLTMELTRIVGQPFFDVARMATGQLVEWYLIRKAFEVGELVPNKPSSAEHSDRRGKRAAGGYVKDPEKGLHENIVYFDFRSLYPSIIISKNVSLDTLVGDCVEGACHVSPEAGYLFLKEPRGFVPSVIGNVLSERVRLKTMMHQATDEREIQLLNVQQEALKRLANSMYGVYGFSRFRWYSLECADAITAWGRDYIKNTMKKAEEFGFKSIYADTDGFYAVYEGHSTSQEDSA